jgi:hypothetical protein
LTTLHRREPSSCFAFATVAIVSLAITLAPCAGRAQIRPEIHPIQTVTVGTKQFLLGVQGGKPTVIGGELRIPARPGKLPAVILLHGSGGLSATQEQWARELNDIGIAVLLVAAFPDAGSQVPLRINRN